MAVTLGSVSLVSGFYLGYSLDFALIFLWMESGSCFLPKILQPSL